MAPQTNLLVSGGQTRSATERLKRFAFNNAPVLTTITIFVVAYFIAGRVYPPSLAGPGYPDGIPIGARRRHRGEHAREGVGPLGRGEVADREQERGAHDGGACRAQPRVHQAGHR